MITNNQFPYYRQYDAMDCGPTCLRMICEYYGKKVGLHTLRALSEYNRTGVNLLGLSKAAENVGFETLAGKFTFEKLYEVSESALPLIVRWNANHFVVVYKVTFDRVYVADPSKGLVKYRHEDFQKGWIERSASSQNEGVFMMLQPTAKFEMREDEEPRALVGNFLIKYFLKFKTYFLQIFLSLIAGSTIQLVFPFLTQSIVDKGIHLRDLGFIQIILIAQVVLFLGKTSIEFIRNWILLHISTRINLNILDEFLSKLMKLPFSFFDSKMSGDIIQRINDHTRIENFLTTSSLAVVFSLINICVLSVVLALYNLPIFAMFSAGSGCYMAWMLYFMKQRRLIDSSKFDANSQNYNQILQIIHGMQDIRLNGCEAEKKATWASLQGTLFKLNINSLIVGQKQQAGAFFFNEGKNILITFFAATCVINGSLSLGMMIAIQYIIGQLNGPVEQLVAFFQNFQDAKLSYERLDDVQRVKDEESFDKPLRSSLPVNQTIRLENVSFKYPGAGNPHVLTDINLEIPAGKVTAIVGMSGSGKTTLLKLLLKLYDFDKGDIFVGDSNIDGISHRFWRSQCGVVMQDAYIFSDTIANNITMGKGEFDLKRLDLALEIANLSEYVSAQPMGIHTKIGAEGTGLSQGQKQRILIARAVYKNPKYIFLDEATNSLDANNEMVIVNKLNNFFEGRTVIIVAHRLSTVKNADKIIVLNNGSVVEEGNHEFLTLIKGFYYELVKNQLELGV